MIDESNTPTTQMNAIVNKHITRLDSSNSLMLNNPVTYRRPWFPSDGPNVRESGTKTNQRRNTGGTDRQRKQKFGIP